MLAGSGVPVMARAPIVRRRVRIKFAVLLFVMATAFGASAQSAVPAPRGEVQPTSQHLTAEQDRARLLGLLGLKESDMRPAPVPDAKSPHATNYDEAKADVYPNLPDPLVFKSGEKLALMERHGWAARR